MSLKINFGVGKREVYITLITRVFSILIMLQTMLFAICIHIVIWNNIYTQSMYKEKSHWHNDLKRDIKDAFLQSSIEDIQSLLKETTFQLKECKSTELSVSESYKQLLIMINTGTFPNDGTIDNMCRNNSRLIFKSATDCHRYYDCSEEDTQLSSYIFYGMWPAKFKHECHFPFMFSEETLQCENYTKVSCGWRFKPTWECRYFRLQCKFSHCTPCDYRYPKCEDKNDGFFMATENEFSNRYMICKDKRRIGSGTCPWKDPVWGGLTFPYNGKCSHLYEIPTDFNENGRLPSCKGKSNGNYQFPDRPCDAYYKCKDSIASPWKCPYGTEFDFEIKQCLKGGNCTV